MVEEDPGPGIPTENNVFKVMMPEANPLHLRVSVLPFLNQLPTLSPQRAEAKPHPLTRGGKVSSYLSL